MKKMTMLLLFITVTACATPTKQAAPKQPTQHQPSKQPPRGFWTVRGTDILFCFKQDDTTSCSRFPKHSFIKPKTGMQF